MARPGQIATHCSQAMQPLDEGRQAEDVVPLDADGVLRADVVQGLQGISWEQWKTGKTPASSSGISSVMTAPGRDLRTSAVLVPLRRHLADVAAERPGDLRPRMRPVNMAAEASAISSASPAAKTGRPNSLAFLRNSSTGSRPTATSTVSQ